MVLPLILAMNASEMSSFDSIPFPFAYMACHFSTYGEGIANIPSALPEGCMLILNDRMPCQGHSADLAASQIADAVTRFGCESVLLDFQRPGNVEAEAVVRSIVSFLSCPVAVSECYAAGLSCPVFLPPNPLHIPLSEYLAPYKGREIWLEAALCQEAASVTKDGAVFSPQFPPEGLEGGFFDESLCCRYRTEIRDQEVRFTLFDTFDSLENKLELARSLGVTRAVGLFQELGSFPDRKV